MTSPRNLLLIALLFLSYLLWLQWQEDYAPRPHAQAAAGGQAAPVPSAADAPPPVPTGEAPAAPAPPDSPLAAGIPAAAPVVVTTDVLRVEIDLAGGNIVRVDLLDYAREHGSPEPVRLLDDDPARLFIAQSGLVSSGQPAPDHRAAFSAGRQDWTLADGEERIEVPLTWQDAGSGITVHKVFTFERGSYVIAQRQEVDNQGSVAWTGNAYRQLQRVPPDVDTRGLKGYTNVERYSFAGAAWYSPAEKFQKLKFDRFQKDPLQASTEGGWAAMLQHYFFAAWIPPAGELSTYSTATVPAAEGQRYLVRVMSPAFRVEPGDRGSESARLYVGPKTQGTLEGVAPGLSLAIDYGIFTILSEPLHWILAQFHRLTGNWGFAIILLVVLIKAVFFKLSETQYRSMAKMRKLQPRVAALKERYGDDRQKMNQAMMELYQKEKANPLAGCLPMLVQMPVFFALYWVLIESVELRQAPFIGWIHNLTAPDPYFILPLINGLVMVATQYLTPMTGMDPTQARMMRIMPVVFSVVFAFFPAGLVLYWTVNGLLSLIQQWVIMRRFEAGEARARAS